MTAPDAGPGSRRGASSRVRLAALGVLLLTLVVGVAIGWSARRWTSHRGRPDDRGASMRIGDRFLDRLDLSAAQRARVDSILERRRGQLDAFWSGPGTQLRAIVDSTREEVRSVLTPAQRAAYDSISARRRRERGGSRGPGFGPPAPR